MGFSDVLLAAAIVTWLITFWASRGQHSQIHHHIAWVALRLEMALLVCGVLGLQGLGSIIVLAVAGCFLAVFVTDSFFLKVLRVIRG